MMCHPSVQRPLIWMLFLLPFRNGEPRSAGAGGAGLPHALSPGLPRVPPRDDEAVLEEGPGREAHLRVHPVLPGRLLHRHGAAVPARGQPLDQPLGGRGVQHRGPWCGFWGTWVNIQGWGGGGKGWVLSKQDEALMRLHRKRYWSKKLFYNHSSAKKRREKIETRRVQA